jgi:alkaline phosphatase D
MSNETKNSRNALPAPSRFIFGSCNSQHFQQPFWDVIIQRDVTAFIWAGDAVYADDRRDKDGNVLDATPEYLRQLYQKQRSVPGYQELTDKSNKLGVSIFGAMDDHDFGKNNGDKTFRWKQENGIEFVKFLGLDATTSAMARRAFNGKGVYGVQVYDFSRDRKEDRLLSDWVAGLDPDVVSMDLKSDDAQLVDHSRSVAVFVLDVRTNKTPWSKKIPDRYSLYSHGDFLGEEQWKWFEEAIGRSNAAVNIVVSGVQVHAPWFYDGNLIENWSAFPRAQHRLYQALLQPNVKAPLLVTGDIHLAQLLRKDCQQKTYNSDTSSSAETRIRTLYEITTSGMTHSWGSTDTSICGRPTLSSLCLFYPYNALFRGILTFAHYISPWTALLKDEQTKVPQYSLARNVAELELDWSKGSVIVRILNDDGQILLKQEWSIDALSGIQPLTKTFLQPNSFAVARDQLQSAIQSIVPTDDFLCANYGGNPDPMHFAFSVATVIGFAVISFMYPFMICIGLRLAFCRQKRSKTTPKRRTTGKSGKRD